MVLVEKSFPRGGSIKQPVNEKSEGIVFGARQKKKPRKSHQEKQNPEDDFKLDGDIEAVSAELLNYKTIQEEMIVMCYIDEITSTYLKVVLPGRIIGRIPVLSISESYTKLLNKIIENNENELTSTDSNDYKPLNEIYEVGEIVYAKVMKIQKNTESGKINIELSLKPKDVHSNMNYDQIKKGMIFNCCVEEIQDHGYIIETGIQNLRCFLPFDKIVSPSFVVNQQNYNIGQLICIKIEKITKESTAGTAICKEIKNLNNRKIKDLIEPKLEYILPTLIVNFTITKILKDGLQGTIMNGNFTAYCNEHHLSKNDPLKLPKDFKLNSTLNARILYIMPITKLVYVSLNFNNESNDDDEDTEDGIPYNKGDIIENAIVDRFGTGGIILILNQKHKGFITFKSIKSKLIMNYDEDELLSKYYKNSKHKVRIIAYDPIECLYLCTNNESDLNEKYYSLSDVEIGEIVDGVVEGKNKNQESCYYVKIGKLQGYIEKLYLSSFGNFTTNLTENMKIRCRIIDKDLQRNLLYLTNRPEYLSKNIKILKNYSQAKENRVYIGTIVKILEKFILVKFFNNIKGCLYKKDIKEKQLLSSFYEGQTMKFRIISCKDEKIVLGLIEDSYKMGEICSGRIANIMQDGLDVIIMNKNDYDGEDDNDDKDSSNKNSNGRRGLIPTRLLSEFQNLITLHLKRFEINERINEMICIEKNLFSLRDVDYFKLNPIKTWNDIQIGDIQRGYIKNVTQDDIIEIFLPIYDFYQLVKVHMNMLITNLNSLINDEEKQKKRSIVQLHPEQIVYVRIVNKIKIGKTKMLTVTAKLTDVWSGNLNETSNLFAKYLNELNEIRLSLVKRNHYLGKLKIGQLCKVKVQNYDEERNCYVKLLQNDGKSNDDDNDDDIQGIIKHSILSPSPLTSLKKRKKSSSLSVDDIVDCIILWIDYLNEIVYLSNDSYDLNHICEGNQLPKNLINKNGLNGKIRLITNDVIVCSLKRKRNERNPLVLIPTKLHYNDFENSVSFSIIENEFCRLSIIHDQYAIGLFENLWKLWHKIDHDNNELNKIANDRKRKNSENENELKLKVENSKKPKLVEIKDKKITSKKNDKVMVEENNSGEPSDDKSFMEIDDLPKKDEKKTKKRSILLLKDCEGDDDSESSDVEIPNENSKKNDETKTTGQSENKTKSLTIEKPLTLPGPSNFWSNDIKSLNPLKTQDSSSDEDDESSRMNDKKKRKKMTAAEKFQAAKDEESRLREIEEKLADPNLQPETADQFERLVLSRPNDSKTWINYMVFHLQASETDKARMIARKALKKISYREEQELINIWVALLNLELRYGTKESFNDIFKESLLCNDPYKIYTKVLQILTDSKKVTELNELILTCTKKFKDKPEMWKNAAIGYFEIDLHEKAKQLLHKALAVLPERDHINTIVTFANLNHKYGDKETAHALLEQVLTSYPKRVDIWSQYVDMLVKDQDFESARQTLDRAISQKIPLKKMKTLFKKYLDFEKKYGTEENVLKIKEMAVHYVQKEISS